MSHNIITANLWLGAPQILAQQVNCYLRTNFCKNLKPENLLDINCTCISCQQINTKQHAQILFINPESGYTVETVKPILEQIVYSLDTNQKFFFILPEVDQLSAVCANLLLKSLEEPPAGYCFILLAQRYYQVLPTIRSRCNISYLNNNLINISHTFMVSDLERSDKFYRTINPSQPDPQNSIEQELYEILTHQKVCAQDYFLQLINKLNLSDLAQIALLDQIILYWSQLYKQSLYAENPLPHLGTLRSPAKLYANPGSSSAGTYRRANNLAQLVGFLNQQLLQPPVRGSAKIFWRNLFIQLNQILAP